MFLAHFGVGLGLKRAVPRVSLGTLFLASQFIDLLWPTLLLLGLERVRIVPGGSGAIPLRFEHYPWSHSLVMVLVWGGLLGLGWWALRRQPRAALVLGLAVLSHWLLDLIVHLPDLPLTPTGPARVGLGLWSTPGIAMVLELGIFAVGALLYLRTTRAVDAVGRWSLWGLLATLVLIHLGNVYGPPPPDVSAIAWAGQAQWLLVLWGYWVDRHRQAG